jgi:SAM-dependent methyltransferase
MVENLTMKNIDESTVDGFGDEWTRFDQSALPEVERQQIFDRYFSIFPWDKIGRASVGMDVGCGTGRWAQLIAPRIGILHCVDPSKAIEVAKRNLDQTPNIAFHNVDVDSLPVEDHSLDFAYSLGVLHHIPDTGAAMKACTKKLKPGAPFLVYLYYAFDNKPGWFRLLWRISDAVRKVVSRLPHGMRYAVSQLLALIIYFPLVSCVRIGAACGFNVDNWPLSAYRHNSFYTMRTDALDRFGTRLERRFTRVEITHMMKEAGLTDIQFSNDLPFWCAVGTKAVTNDATSG